MLGFLKKFFSMFEGRKTLYLPVLTIGEKSKYTGYTYTRKAVEEACEKCNKALKNNNKIFIEMAPEEQNCATPRLRHNLICGECLYSEIKGNKLYGKFVFYNTENGEEAIKTIKSKRMEMCTASLVKIDYKKSSDDFIIDEMDIFKFNLRPYKA
jgi:hypothetical protein